MAVEEAHDRRGGRVRGRAGLLQREHVLEAIDALLDSAPAGAGQALLISGHPGMGKTRLYEAALDGARARNLRIFRAAGAELEQNLAFGVAGQVARSILSDLDESERRALLDQAPALVHALVGPALLGTEAGATQDVAVSHALFALLAEALEVEPALLTVDDLHWCDPASLEFVLYLLQRLEELPLSVVMTARPGMRQDMAEMLDLVSAHRSVRVETLTPLGSEALGTLVGQALGDQVSPQLIRVCEEATAGNPFYLHELLVALREEKGAGSRELVERARSLAPDAVTRSVRVRIGRLGQDAAALARAVAVLGNDVPLRQAAILSGLEIGRASAAMDALASVEVLLAREPLRFVHPLVQASVQRDIPPGELASRHLEAARLLDSEGAGPEWVAAHLLKGRPEGDPWAIEQLQAAAHEAAGRAGPRAAVPYLERALAEPPPRELRGTVLAELGEAEAVAGLPAALEHLTEAGREFSDPTRRAGLALRRGQILHAEGRHEEAAAAFDEGLAALGEDPEDVELHDALQTDFVATASLVPALQKQAVERSARLLDRALTGSPTHGQRQLLAQAALHASFAGQPAPEIIELAEQSWDEGRLLQHEGTQGLAWTVLISAFCLAGDLERAIELADAAAELAQQTSSPWGFATASYVRGLPQLWQGRVTSAMADLESALDARRFGWRQFARAAAAHFALCLIETGEFDRADAILDEETPTKATGDVEDAARLYALAELRRNQGRLEEALETALLAGEMVERNMPFLGYCPWRGSAALSSLALGKEAQARRLAAEMVERSEQSEILHQRVRSLRIAGMCQGDDRGLELLRRAVEVGMEGPPRLETIRALIELGSALRRGNERAAAREPLQRAADLAKDGGAILLFERARVELSASGGRPRREALLSGLESLTPSERRIAELASRGQSNREIAQTLFVTPKTVEYHLRNTYRKLEIQTRGQLAGALGD